jgi:hypothetical protein
VTHVSPLSTCRVHFPCHELPWTVSLIIIA